MYKFKFNLYQAIKALQSTLYSNSTTVNSTDAGRDNNATGISVKSIPIEDFKNLETIFKKSESEYTSQDKIFILNELSIILMKSQQHCQLISNIFRPLLIDLVSRYIHSCNKRNKKTTDTSKSSKKDSKIIEIENISLIFSQLLPTTPQLLGIVIQYYQNQSSIKKINIFDQILLIKNIKNEKESRWLSLVQSTYRLLSFNRKVFSSLWNWTPLFTLLEIDSHKIRWYVIKTMSMVLNVPDHQIEAIKPFYNQYHHQIVQIEKDIINIESTQIFLNNNNYNNNSSNSNNSSGGDTDTQDMITDISNPNIYIQKEDLDNSIVDICGILLFKKFSISSNGLLSTSIPTTKNNSNNNQQQHNQLVYTNTVSQNLNSLAIAVGLGKPILIEGVTGSGKTTMVEELSKITGNDNIIRIHLGDQTDSKVLLGTYVTSDTPGEFKWQAGALTQAVSEGRWILIEDIDLAPIEVLSVLIPLLESRTLFIPGRGEVIEAANGFQLFATQTLFGTHSRDQNANILSHLWTRVVIEALNTTEMKHVLTTLFPKLTVLIGKFIETFNLLLRVISNGGSVSTSDSDEKFIIPSSRFISSRDLIKWIKRCNQRLALSNVSQMVTSAMKEIVFVEALDCFCSMISKKALRNRLTEVIGKVWELTADRTAYYIDLYKPSINITPSSVTTGRATLESLEKSDAVTVQTKKHTRIQISGDNSQESGVTKHGVFAHTMNSLRLIEKISISIQFNEPILLVGETGTGKTSVVQYVADQLNQKLVVLNLNQQSDSSDLIGGFKPVEMRLLCLPLKVRFDSLFKKTFSEASNSEFLEKIDQSFISKNWKSFINLLNKAIKLVETKVLKDSGGEEGSSTKKRSVRPEIREKWRKLAIDIIKLGTQFEKSKNNFAFSFVEGSLINCIRKGHWVLLDEMNLATSETLESLSGLFDGGSLTLTEKGDVEPVERHPNFRVFACMNPPTDIGKKDLPPGIRNRFTEYFVDDLENKADLCLVVKTILQDLIPHPPIDDIVEFYLKTKTESQNRMLDGSNQKPHFSLRTLSRALNYTKHVTKSFGFQRALYEGISMSFLTQLNRTSYPMMEQLIQTFIKKGDNKLYKQPLNKPNQDSNKQFVQIEQFWIEVGEEKPVVPSHYILTESIKANLANLSRILVSRKHPILLQGPTSSGKTSMVEYLAIRTGHRFIRINNHEHTDLQEYLGQYISDDKGKLVFQEGILVEAVRKGYWVVLDELNLAPSEVLEALNRLLDDNRELFIPETQEVVKPHPHFMLFATQNPPGLYGGRKVLSRAFRNRFLELHVDDIPEHELEEILSKRCALPPSYCKKLVAIMRELQLNRQGSSQVFAGKHGYITFRDLFRWAQRNPSSYDELGVAGYMLLAERLRKEDEKLIIKQVIEKHLKIKLDMESIYACDDHPDFLKIIELLGDQELVNASHLEKIVWTRSMKRLFALVGRCLEAKEPILLVGETGCSKTTICQLYSILHSKKLSILNCHQHTETADFVGGLRPVRGRDQVLLKIYAMVKQFYAQVNVANTPSNIDDIPIKELVEKNVVSAWKELSSTLDTENNQEIVQLVQQIEKSYSQYCSLFTWVDGPLVESMKQGHYFLIDEISLAEDAVLERLNSVLEPSRLLVLAEKGGVEIEELRGHQDFRILATMNPGGDFGKKELSPAMRNRFTEIWVPAISNHNDLLQIVEERFKYPQLKGKGSMMLEFIEYLLTIQKNKRVISLRDILSWISFMNLCIEKNLLSANESYIHGACLVLLDGFGMGSNSSSESEGLKLRDACLTKLLSQIAEEEEREILRGSLIASTTASNTLVRDETRFGIHPFYINAAPASNATNLQFSMNAPTTFKNALRVLRGMQLPRAILVEGSPGVGKTSLITAIAKASGNNIVRINLSEQTDIMDLLGSDLPVEGGTGGQFEWRDGVFLEALKNGSWVLLDELNLASQTVLEGLNSCLDHRSEVYIPELGKTFACHPNFRVFACQNPLHQGGGRKGLPKSFLNRFTQVFIDQLDQNDLLFISESMYPLIPSATLEKMIKFNHVMHKESMVEHKFGRKGAPWEFNLRDTFRWCDLIVKDPKSISNPGRFIDVIYLQRMRTLQDREYVKSLYRRVFPEDDSIDFSANQNPSYSITPDYVQIGSSILARQKSPVEQTPQQLDMANIEILQRLLNPLENLMKCIEMNWMSILIGQTSSSKTSAIRLLAQLTGNTLYEFSMNSSVDTTEILGGFEQIDLVRYQRKIISSSYELIKQISSNLLSKITDDSLQTQIVACITDLHHVWNIFKAKQSQLDTQEKSNKGPNDQTQAMVNSELLDILVKILAAIEKVLEQFGSSFEKDVIANIELLVADTRKQISRISSIEKESVTGCFEWIDGLLIKALEQGAWILIDNVNFCNPTVLDRLNPLLEQGGVLMLNERGMVDGQVKVITPHPNFRIFLTMDDRKGEISRAMRNRGIEIYLPEQNTFVNQDNLRLLTAIGIPSESISNSMIKFHNAVYTQFSSTIENPVSLSQLLYWGKLLLDQLQRGISLELAISNSMEQIYIRPRRHLNQRTLIQSIYKEYFNSESVLSIQQEMIQGMDVLGVYPHFVKGSDYVKSSTTSTLVKNAEFMQHYHKLMLDDDNGSNENYYQISSKFFIESSNSINLADRIGYLDALKESNQDYSSTVQSMKKLFKHPVYTRFEKKITLLFSLLNVNSSDAIILYQGYQWKNNESLFKLIQEKVDHFNNDDSMETTESPQSLWSSVVNSMTLLSLLMEQSIQTAKQDKQLKAFEKSPPANIGTAKFMKQTPVFLVSFAYAKKMISRDILNNDLISFIYRIFDSLDQQIDQWFVELQDKPTCTATTLKTLGSIIRLKNNFYASLVNNCNFNVGEFIIRWKWICKEIKKLGVDMNTQISILFENINAIIHSFDTNSNNRLWKVGGHPIVMRSEELVTLDSEFLALVDKIQYNFNKTLQQQSPLTHSSFSIDQEWRKTLVEAFTTLYWANFQLNSDDQTPQQIQDIVKNIQQVPSLLADKLKELIEKQNNRIKVLPQVDAPHTEDGLPIIQNVFYDPVSLKHHSVALWPLIDHTLAQRETKVMMILMQFLLSQHMDLKNGCMKDSIEPLFINIIDDLKYIVEHYKSSNIPRSLYHLVFYQKLIWMIDNYLATETRSSIGIIELQSIVHSILYVYNSSLWNNAYNDLGYVGKASLPQYKYNMVSNNDVAKTASNPFDTIRFGYGPPRLFQNIQSIFSFYLTSDWDFVSIADVPGKVEQLEQVIQHLTSPTNSNDNQESMNHQYIQMFWLLINTVSSSYSKVYSDNSDFDNTIQEISKSLEQESQFKQEFIENLKQLITNSSDKHLNQMSMKLLVPALDIMISYFNNKHILVLRNQNRLGKLVLLISCFRMIMYVPSHPIDPTQKYNVILDYSTETSQQLADEIFIRKEIEKLTTGKETNMIIVQLEQLLQETDHQISLQKKKVTPRPVPSQFDQLHRDVSQFSHHFSNIEKVLDLIKNFNLIDSEELVEKDVQEYQMLYSTETMWQEKANHFIQSLEKKFYSRYRDVVVPIITSVYQMKQGLRYMADAYKQAVTSQDVLTAKQDIQKVLRSLTQFPTSSSSNDMLFLDKNVLDSIKQMMRANTRDNQDNGNGGVKNIKAIALLLRSSLCQVYNQLTISNHLCVDTLTLIDTIFRVFVEEWRFQEEEKRKKEALENQSFKYKVQSHKMETKEEKDEKVFLSSFPSFYKDFQDLETTIVVEQDEAEEAKEADSAESTEPGVYDDMFFKNSINDQEIIQLCQIHRDIFTHLDGIPRPNESSNNWKLCEKDRVELFQLFYSCSYLLIKVLNQRVDDIEFDHLSMGSHIMSASYLKDTLSVAPISHITYSKLDEKFKFLKTASYLSKKADPSAANQFGINESTTVISQGKVYNIYTDPNIPEIGIIRKPMQEFRDRVFELLAEFPDHPNLTLIVKLIDRLLTYPATDSLIKILTGLELLLRKSLEWESFAHKGVSIQSHLDILSRLITRWRKLEIESWPSIFQNQEKQSEIKALKVWFILYDLINDDPETDFDANIEKNFKTLQEYLFCSTLGDFLTRLELLKTFHLQLQATVKLINSPEKIAYKQKLSTIILNIYKYFYFFVPRFESKLAKEIKPIEDKAIEFIKLSRWEDNKLLTQYERLKNHIEKSHRNLAKITIKYKNVLNLPLHDIFSQMDNDMDIPSQILIPGQQVAQKKKKGTKAIAIGNKEIITVSDWVSWPGKNFISSIATAETSNIANREIKSLFKLDHPELNSNKLTKLFKKMQQISKKDLLESDCYVVVREGVDCLDSMGGEIIERIEYLSNESNEVKTSEKALSLNLLYSKLKELGLSFNTNQYPQEQLQIAYLFNIATLPEKSELPRKDGNVVESGASLVQQSDSYFYRIVSRIHRLRTLSLEHHSDLSARDLQRTGGFVEHLLAIIIANRKQSSAHLKYWNYLISFIKLFSTNDTIFPHQSNLFAWIEKQRALVNQLYHSFEEISLLCSKTSSLLISNDLKSIQSSVDKMKLSIDQHQSQFRSLYTIIDGQHPLLTNASLTFLLDTFEQINSVKQRLANLLDQQSIQSLNYLKNPLKSLYNSIDSIQSQWNAAQSSMLSQHSVMENSESNVNNVDQFMKLFDKIIKHILVAIQELKETSNSITKVEKLEEPAAEKENSDNEDDEEEKEFKPKLQGEELESREHEIQDGHISKIDQFLQKQFKSLDLKGLLMTLIELHLFVVDSANGTSIASLNQYRVMLQQLYPLLNQYILLVNQCILDQMAFGKTLSKLEYIMLSVFIQLYQKGFCKSDKDDEGEATGESNGKFEDDVEGTGMGEGKGKKDVSDEIEDQEQLMGTNTDEKDEQEDEDDEKEEKDEDEGFDMTDDFEGDMHDIKKDPKKEDEKEDPNQDELDKEMGELEKPEDKVVDEKLWNDEEDIQEDDVQDEEGEGAENTDEMVAKDDKEKKDNKKDEKKDEKKKEKRSRRRTRRKR
ncbi:hypothetical protein CYY_002268 [Polysphondylium violaceum]|uniref:Midasin n=1 Tax=Polysphondylium violaceum TaxID=133409 RepID=A0A8J4UVA7_9MYCE|nr:hypothetical protein CYY_002268 [Polysphondylium violaceum]